MDNLLPSLFQPLDWELYALVQSTVTEREMLSMALIVDQVGKSEASHAVRSPTHLRSVAVIDRTADVEKAARQILSAHLAFSGQSPHAPDLIIVNEWVKDKFIDAMIRERLNQDRELHRSHADKREIAWKKAVTEAQIKGEATLIQKDGLHLIHVHQR